MTNENSTQNKKPLTIEKQKLLFVEGKDEISFFKVLLKKMKIEEDIQIIECGGKDTFKSLFPVIMQTPGSDNVISMAVIQDADQDSNKAFQRISKILRNNDLNPPETMGSFQTTNKETTSSLKKVGIFVIPDGINQGNLESLCLSTIFGPNSIEECFGFFIKCVRQKIPSDNSSYEEPKNIYKAYCRAFLATREEDIPSLGVAAQKNIWNLDSEKLKLLSDFLKKL